MKKLKFSIGILSWKGYDSLYNSLKSYEENGLSSLTQFKFICLPEYNNEGIKICKSFGMNIKVYDPYVNEKIISWIKESEMDVLFCPDYDPVGLDEYSKIKDSAPQRVRLFMPDSIEDDFKYSTSELLDKKKNREVLSRLASYQPIDHDFGKVLSLIQQWNAGLMQEIYFVD